MNDVTVMGVPVVFHGGCYSDSEGLDWDAMPEECMDEQPRFEYGQAVKVSKECTNCRPETVGRVGIVTRVVEPMAWGETLYDVRLQEVRSKWMYLPERHSSFQESSLEPVRRSALKGYV